MSNLSAPIPPAPRGFLRSRILGAPAVSRTRWAVALLVAVLADVAQIVLWPMFTEGAASPFDDALDAAVAVILLGTLGFSGRLGVALALELVPGLDLFPTWSALVLTIPVAKNDVKGSLPTPTSK